MCIEFKQVLVKEQITNKLNFENTVNVSHWNMLYVTFNNEENKKEKNILKSI